MLDQSLDEKKVEISNKKKIKNTILYGIELLDKTDEKNN